MCEILIFTEISFFFFNSQHAMHSYMKLIFLFLKWDKNYRGALQILFS